MHQRNVTIPNWVLAVLWYPPLRLPSLQRSYRPRPLQKTWTREGLNPPKGGGALSCEWFTSVNEGGGPFRSDRSLPVAKDCPQYIPKGNPTPASKLAFVTWRWTWQVWRVFRKRRWSHGTSSSHLGRWKCRRWWNDRPCHLLSISDQSLFFFKEAGIICSRQADGSVELNSSGERVINLREWAFLLSHQRIKLRRQEIKRSEWEKLPWTGHLCYLFIRAWEIGRAKSQFKRDKDYTRMRDFSENVRRSGCD